MQLDLQNAYTVGPLQDKTHQQILHKWVQNNDQPMKASMCRYFLRGMCIMKKQYCKFAHGMDDFIEVKEEPISLEISEKQRKKIETNKKSFYNQKALFLCPLKYYNLYEFSKQTNPKNPISLETLNTDDDIRNKLRIKFHRQQWQKFMDYLQKRYPLANITVPFLSDKYSKYGFCKPHTHCKLHNILYWIEQGNFYIRHEITLPPLLNSKISIVFKRYSKKPIDKIFLADYEWLQKNGPEEKPVEIDKNKLNQDLIKQYIKGKFVNQKTTICKFYMKGLCLFSEQECKYCHSFQTIKYTFLQNKIMDLQYFEQKALFAEPKLNYISLYYYQQLSVSQSQKNKNIHSLQQINKDSNLRQQLRNKLHMDLYRQFLNKMEELYPDSNWTMSFLRRQYTNCGLNKTKVDKFPSFVDKLQQLGYQIESFVVPPYKTIKKQFVFKRPSSNIMDKQISITFLQIIEKRLSNSQQQEQIIITQPYIRKKFYQLQRHFTVPVHRYLKLRNITLKDYIQQQIDTNDSLQPLLEKFSFDLKDNIEKIKETLKQYYNTNKVHQHKYSDIEVYIKNNCYENIKNYITTSGLKWCIVGQSLQLHKQIYIFPNNQIIICGKKHNKQKQEKCSCKVQKIQAFSTEQSISQQILQKYKNQRIVLVDSIQSLSYSKEVVQKIDMVGVDLEGNLKEDGFIYLIQFGIKNPFSNKNQIFVFDIWSMKNNKVLIQKTRQIIKFTLQNEQIIKIMHDCKNDSVALHYLLDCCLYPVFDTCAMQVYFDQKQINSNWKQKQQFIRSLFKIFNKTLGLNQILEKYGRPVNELKDYMRKLFEADKQTKQKYFEARPIQPDFLQYAVRDVEQLVDTFNSAVKYDEYKIWKQIGLSASTFGLK